MLRLLSTSTAKAVSLAGLAPLLMAAGPSDAPVGELPASPEVPAASPEAPAASPEAPAAEPEAPPAATEASPTPPTAAEAPAKRGSWNLFRPRPRAQMRELSTDRPDTTESPYTVDAGHVQLEMSFFDHTSDKPSGGARVSTTSVAPVLLKVGLHDNVDLQLGLDPWTTSKATGGAATEGFGDTLVRLKINLWGNDEGRTAFALMPFVTVPTAADGLGVSAVEGGLIALLGVALDEEWALGLMAEVDLVTSPDGEDYVADFLHTATVGRGIVGDLGGYVEYAGFVHLHGKEDYRAYFDAGLTYALDPEVQLDAGVRVGLTEASEDLGFFTGLSLRR